MGDDTDRLARTAEDFSTDRFHRAFHSAPTGMALIRLEDNRIVDANRALADMLAIDEDLLVGCTLREFTHPDDIGIAQGVRAQLELGVVDQYEIEHRLRRTDDAEVWARIRVSITDDAGVPLAIAHVEDVTEPRRAAEQLGSAAIHDDITGLANRVVASEHLDGRLADDERPMPAVLVIDLDDFRSINHGFDHQFADEVLRSIGRRMVEVADDSDLVARFGSDEFLIVTDGDAAALGERVRAAVDRPMSIDGHDVFVTASVGFAIGGRDGSNSSELLRRADVAVQRVKSRGGNAVERARAIDARGGAINSRLTGELRDGIAAGEIVPYYQPMVDLETGAVIGYEVLARWRHPDQGLLLPEDFIELADRSGLIGPLTQRVIDDALAQLQRWADAEHALGNAKLSFDVSSRQWGDPAFVEHLASSLADHDIAADRVWLEVAAGSFDESESAESAERIRLLGAHLMADGVGRGQLSLGALHRLPIEALKIDASLVSGAVDEDADSSLIAALAGAGRALSLDVIALGVEIDAQADRLRAIGCTVGQGYLFGRPRPADLIEREPGLIVADELDR